MSADSSRSRARSAGPLPVAAPGRGGAIATFLAAALPLLVIDAITLHRGLPAGDSGELIAAAATWGVAHPPGYPLYVMLAGAWMRVCAFGNPAFRLDLFSTIAMSAAAGVLALTVTRLSGRRAGGLFAAYAFALAAPVWKYAIVAEVFALNALLASLVLFALASWGAANARTALLAIAFLAVLAISHHHTLLLLALPASFAVLPGAWRDCAGRRVALVRDGAAIKLLALLPLAWLPFATRRAGAQVWGQADTWRGFCSLLLRSDYGTLRLDPAQAAMHADRSHAVLFLQSLPHDLGLPLLLAAVPGAIVLARRHRRVGGTLLAFAALQLLFFTRVGFPSGVAVLRGVVERFYILPDLVLALVAGVGAAWVVDRTWAPARSALATALVALAAGTALFAHARAVDQRANALPETLGRGVLASLPLHAVLFVRGDALHNALAYLTIVEHRRPDVTVLDQELMTYPWYIRRVRAGDPALLPPLDRAERIGLRDGRSVEGVAIPRADGTVDVLTEDGQGTLPAAGVMRVTPAPAAVLYARTRAGFASGWPHERSEDRYSGLPGSRNLLWLDHLAGRRPVAMLGPKDDSFALRYELTTVGFAAWVSPRGRAPDAAQQAEVTLAMLDSVSLDPYFAAYDPRSFEYAERSRFAAAAARAALVMCQPAAAAAVHAHPTGAARLRTFAGRFEELDPVADAACLRAIGFLRLFDPGFRDEALAQRDLERYLASGAPIAEHDTEARRTLEQLHTLRNATRH